jgi:hypothetical protein
MSKDCGARNHKRPRGSRAAKQRDEVPKANDYGQL